jgi:Uma2 family endonuclease
MSASTRISFDEFLKMQEAAETICYELDEGELIQTPSPTIEHNEIRYRIHRGLRDFSRVQHLGYVTGETDFLLSEWWRRNWTAEKLLRKKWKRSLTEQ